MAFAYNSCKKRSMLARWEKHEGVSAKQEEDRRRWERTVVNKSGTRVSVIDLSRLESSRLKRETMRLDGARYARLFRESKFSVMEPTKYTIDLVGARMMVMLDTCIY